MVKLPHKIDICNSLFLSIKISNNSPMKNINIGTIKYGFNKIKK